MFTYIVPKFSGVFKPPKVSLSRKRRFTNLIKENYKETFTKQKNKLFDSLESYQGEEDRNDDLTVIGFKI